MPISGFGPNRKIRDMANEIEQLKERIKELESKLVDEGLDVVGQNVVEGPTGGVSDGASFEGEARRFTRT